MKKENPADAKPEHEDSWWDEWLEQCYAGRNRPKWTARMVPPLEKMLRAEAPKERVAAAVLLAPLGKASESVPVLQETVRANPELLETAVKVLPWLVWEERARAFRDFRSAAKSDEAIGELTSGIGAMPDPRAADLFWQLLAEPKIKAEAAPHLLWALTEAYFGSRYISSDVPPAVRRRVIEAAKPRALSGGDWQRRAALALLATAAKDEAAETAAKLADDAGLSDAVRTEAFQVQLVVQPESEARRSALAALRNNHPKRKTIALRYLAHGPGALHTLPSGLHALLRVDESYSSSSDGNPIVPQPPAGLKLDDVRPLLARRGCRRRRPRPATWRCCWATATAWPRCCATGGEANRAPTSGPGRSIGPSPSPTIRSTSRCCGTFMPNSKDMRSASSTGPSAS